MRPVHNILGFKVRMRFDETHHLYWGIIIALIFGWLQMPILCVIGLLIALDDVYQHHRQVDEVGYHSPVHRAYAWVYHRVGWIRNLNIMIDNFIGRKNE